MAAALINADKDIKFAGFTRFELELEVRSALTLSLLRACSD